ncbi:MAG: GTP cyclohydrolase II [Methylocystis sp.]|uniref:GTP cyclohydrolase II n=1 Tax=Methylocystis sp. TaxID=1911079 RepID=UPI003DA539D4
MNFSTIDEAVAAQQRGGFVIVVDDECRENEGDLILPAEKMTPEAMAFMVRHTSGVVCVALPDDIADRLSLPLMAPHGGDAQGTAFTVTVDCRHGLTTGISARERSATARALADSKSSADDFVRPGHIFPLRRHWRGILGRRGHTEAASELAARAGCAPVGVLCEIVREDGEMARRDDLFAFAQTHDLPIVQIADLVDYAQRRADPLTLLAKSRLPTRHGEFAAHVFRANDGAEHVAFVMGDLRGAKNVLTRVHSECLTGDLLGSLRCDCGGQLDLALRRIAQERRGILIYLRGHEGRGVGLTQKLRAYELQDQGADTVDANLRLGLPVDARNYHAAGAILSQLGVRGIRLMSNNPHKATELARLGVSIEEIVALHTAPNGENIRYLEAKRSRMGHQIDHLDASRTFEAVMP